MSRSSRISSSAVRKVAPGLRAASTPRQHDRRYCELSPVPQRSSDGYDCMMISLCSGRDLTRLSQQIFAGSTRECAGGRDIANRPRGMFRPDPRLGAGLAASAAANSSSPRIATSAPTPSGLRRAKIRKLLFQRSALSASGSFRRTRALLVDRTRDRRRTAIRSRCVRQFRVFRLSKYRQSICP